MKKVIFLNKLGASSFYRSGMAADQSLHFALLAGLLFETVGLYKDCQFSLKIFLFHCFRHNASDVSQGGSFHWKILN